MNRYEDMCPYREMYTNIFHEVSTEGIGEDFEAECQHCGETFIYSVDFMIVITGTYKAKEGE